MYHKSVVLLCKSACYPSELVQIQQNNSLLRQKHDIIFARFLQILLQQNFTRDRVSEWVSCSRKESGKILQLKLTSQCWIKRYKFSKIYTSPLKVNMLFHCINKSIPYIPSFHKQWIPSVLQVMSAMELLWLTRIHWISWVWPLLWPPFMKVWYTKQCL